MANIGYATLSVIPSAAGFGAALSKGIAPGMASAGAAGGAGLLGALKKAMPVVAVTAAVGGLFAIGKVFDVMTDTIRVGTGASGAALDALTESAKNVGRNSASSFSDIGTAIAGISSRTGQTGPALEDLTRQMLLMTKLTGGDLSTDIAGVTRVFGDWSIATGDQSKAADFLFKVHQATGASIDSLSQKVVQFGAPLRQLGFSFEESAVLLGKWEKEGVNTGTVLAGMKIGLGTLSKAGIEPVQGLKDVQAAIMGAGSAGEANLIAIKTFGQRAGPDMAAAVREGRFSLDELMGTINGSEETILGAASATSSFSGKWQKFKNNVLIAIQPIATKVFDAFGTGMQFMNDTGLPAIQAFGAAFSDKVGPALEAFGAFITGTVVPAIQGFIAEFRDGEGAGGAFRAILEGLWNNVLVPLAGFVTGTLVPAIQGFVSGFQDGTGPGGVFRDVITGIYDAVVTVADYITGTAIPAVKDFGKWVGENKTPILSVAGVITAIFLPAIVRAGVLSTISAAKQVAAWVVMAAQAIISGAETVAIWVLIQASAIRATVVSVAQFVIQGAKWVWMGVIAAASAVVLVAAWVATGAGAIAASVVSLAQFVVQGAKWVWLGVVALAGAAQIALAWLISMGPIGLVIAAVVGLAVLIALNFERIKGWIGGAWEWIKTATMTAWTAISNFLAGLWATITGAVSTAWNGIVGFFSAIPGRVGAFFTMVKDKVVEVFGYTPMGLIVNNWDAIVGFFTGLPGKIGSAVAGMWDGITDSFRSALNTVIRWWNDFSLDLRIPSNSVTDFLHLSGAGFTVRTPNISPLAEGALVTNPALAMLGESGHEAVLPFSRVDEFAGMLARAMATMDLGKPDGRQGAGNTVNVYPTPGMSEQQIGDAAARQLSWAMRG